MPVVGTVAASEITLGLGIGTRGRSLQDRQPPLHPKDKPRLLHGIL